MMQYDHIYAAICIMIKLKVMFWKLYTRIYFNVGTFNFMLYIFRAYYIICYHMDIALSH